jgi:peptidoglycan/LPS O-acetylase OafA/YrhL
VSKAASNTLDNTAFRRDINGLRAFAVLAVLLYHFGVPGIRGGFAGVDVFFVISGFLMAGIVCRGLDQGSFSLRDFYLARARRIWPVLLVVCLAVLVIGWLLLMPSEYETLGKHARDSVLFSSNIRYLKEVGYFDVESQQKWLLHTWSLSVEWQFYLLYPLVLLAVHKLAPGRRSLVVAHVLVAVATFGLSVYMTEHQPEAAFFVLQSRAWELLLGGLVFLLGSPGKLQPGAQRGLEGLGLAMILASVLFVDNAMLWPGALALLPTLGTCLVLLAARQDSLWTANVLAQWLGTRSYSLYLWHWPLVVLLAYFERQHAPLWIAAGLLLACLLAHLSYHAVEVPCSRWLGRKRRARAALYLVIAAALLAHAAQRVDDSGIPGRLPAAVARIDAEASDRNPKMSKCLDIGAPCVYGGADIRALVIGDSHADAVVTAVAASLPDPRQGVYFRARAGCLTVDTAHKVLKGKKADTCFTFKQEMFGELPTLYPGKPLILINRTSGYALGAHPERDTGEDGPEVYFSQPSSTATPEFLEEFRHHYVDAVCRLTASHPVYILRPLPEMPVDVPLSAGRAALWGKTLEPFITRAQYQQRHAFALSIEDEAVARCGAVPLDPLPYLCDAQKCYGTHDGRPVYADDNHLSEYGNKLLVPLFRPLFAPPATSAP